MFLKGQIKYNIILDTDSYKASHFKQYPLGTQYVYSYIESRGGKWDKTVFNGMQLFILRYMTQQVTMADIDEAEKFFKQHGEPFNREGWEHIVNAHNGYLPLEIKAVPEGTVIEGKNILVSIKNTDPKCFWLTSYAETMILRAAWYATTIATNSWTIKRTIKDYVEKTCDDPTAVMPFMLNDFGARGVSCYEQAEIGGIAHLINFAGTDNVPAVRAAQYYFGAGMAGFSIPAAEHSTITSWGDKDQEYFAFANMIEQFKENKIFAVVSDSYNIWDACSILWGERLKKKVIESGARVVVRPDSGDPRVVPVKCIEILMDKFRDDVTFNKKGFKVLPPYIRVIQGDGIDHDTVRDILGNLLVRGISAENICFGSGGALLQKVNRDTLKFAMKCSAICVDGKWRDVFKSPVTDNGKISKKGVMKLIYQNGKYETVRESIPSEVKDIPDQLRVVYRNGEVFNMDTLDTIRKRSESIAIAA